MLSDLQKKKFSLLFKFNDLDGDGKISAEDFDHGVANYADEYQLGPDTPEKEELRSVYGQQWAQLKAFDTDGDGRIGVDEYLAGWDAWMPDQAGITSWVDSITDSFYAVVDRDKDGSISEEELVMNFRAHGASAEAARRAFTKLDRNGDGVISKDEMLEDLKEVFLSDDPEAPGNWIALSIET